MGSAEPVNAEVLKWLGYVFTPIGPMLFGILYDTSKVKTQFLVKISCLVGALIHAFGYWFDWPRMMAIGFLFVALTSVALLSISTSAMNDAYPTNKIGACCAFIFWLAIAEIWIYLSEELILNMWWTYGF